MAIIIFLLGIILYIIFGTRLYTVRPDECAVKTSFGKALRIQTSDDNHVLDELGDRYSWPKIVTQGPGGPYLKLPWERVYRVRVSTDGVDLTWDPTRAQSSIEAVTKDNLTTDIRGQIRYRVTKGNIYPFVFGVESPLEHVMGYFISVMRERISNFVDPNSKFGFDSLNDSNLETSENFEGISINDIRKNLPLLNRFMEEQCIPTVLRYGIELDAALITEIDPPIEVDQALSAINSTRNQVAADISTARADAEQQITMSKRAVEIAQNNAEAEVAPLIEISNKLVEIKTSGGSQALKTYVRNVRIPLLSRTKRLVINS